MRSRERAQMGVNFQEADTVPIDLGGLKASGIAVGAHNRVTRKLGLGRTLRVLGARFMIAVVEEPVLKRFNIDVVPMGIPVVHALMSLESQWVPRRISSGTDMARSFMKTPTGTGYCSMKTARPVRSACRRTASMSTIPYSTLEGIKPANFKPIEDIPDKALNLLCLGGGEAYTSCGPA